MVATTPGSDTNRWQIVQRAERTKKMATRDEELLFLYDSTFEWINVQREKFGMAPIERIPKGIVESTSCPVAKGLSNGWKADTRHWSTTIRKTRSFFFFFGAKEEWTIAHPAYVKEFIKAFDRGEYPELKAV